MTTPFTVWLTGLPCSGKSTLAKALALALHDRNVPVQVLDGDAIRPVFWPELGFSRDDRDANVRRTAKLAELFTRQNVAVIVALVSPYADTRRAVRANLDPFVEVFVDCPVAECARRDVKGLYAAQRAGKLSGLTGVDDPYERPENPDVHLHTDRDDVPSCVAAVVETLTHEKLL